LLDPALAAATALGHRHDEEAVEATIAAAGEETVDVGYTELWLISHYTCLEDNYGGTHYCPWGRATASGVAVSPGVAACEPRLLGQSLTVAGLRFTCADTGGAIGPGVIDIWAYSFDHWGPPGTPQYDQPPPAPCEVVIGGRCYAEVTVEEES
jgi:3D (Asp-Asp-Asp) domain-containing protein